MINSHPVCMMIDEQYYWVKLSQKLSAGMERHEERAFLSTFDLA